MRQRANQTTRERANDANPYSNNTMNAACARCGKTVYPTEKLNAINQTFHKGCFKCIECNITLNLRTFQSFDQKPYCSAHVPKPTSTGVTADSVELQRLKNVSNITSQVVYKSEFEKSRGDAGSYGTAVADTPAMKMSMKNTAQQSQVKYKEAAAAAILQTSPTQPGSAVSEAARHASSSYTHTVARVEETAPSPTPALAPPNTALSATYQAAYTYQPDAEDELAFEVGDRIIEAQLVAEGWLFGVNERTGMSGLVPEPYCTRV